MTLKKLLTIAVFCVASTVIAQQSVCTSSTSEFDDLNSIGKCAIENFKKSKNKEFIKVSSRSRYVRKKSNPYLKAVKKNLKAVANYNDTKNTNTIADNNALMSDTDKNTLSKNLLIKDFLRFDQVNEVPTFITCDDTLESIAKDECNKETIIGIILENLIYPFDAAASGIHGKVWVRFIINQDGYVTNVTTKGPENGILLEREAERLVNLLPKFMPGKHNGNYVNVEYFMPIDFELDE